MNISPRALRPAGRRIGVALAQMRRSLHRLRPAVDRVGRVATLLIVAGTGVALGVLLGGHTTQDIGPFRAELSVSPALRGDTAVEIPPLGSLWLDSHDGPAKFTIRLDSLDEARTRDVVSGNGGLGQSEEDIVQQLATGVRHLAIQVAGVTTLGAMILAALVYRRLREVAICGGLALAILAGTALAAQQTFRPDAIQEPRYQGLLTNAPAVIGDVQRIADHYEEYRIQLQRLVANVSRLYGTISTLPVYEPDSGTTRVLHISDLHLNPAAWSVVSSVVTQFNIQIVVDTGDITDWGSEPEDSYVSSIAALRVPYVYVRGNHDSTRTQAAVARQPNAIVLENQVKQVGGLTFAGTGDPRFTPDKSTVGDDEAGARAVRDTGAQLAETIADSGNDVDVAVVHDPVAAGPLAGAAPVVLAGHRHNREVRRIDPSPDTPILGERSLLMVEGSTGGAGLRGLEKDQPLPLALSVLYFDRDGKLQAYDDINVGGTGLSEVSLVRSIVKPDDEAPVPASPSPVSPSPVSPSPGSPSVGVPASPTVRAVPSPSGS